MRSAGNFSPEWGYLAPAPSFMRTARIVLVATAVGATAGAGVVLALIDRPAAEADKTSVAARAIVTSVQAAPSALAAPVVAVAPSAPAAPAPATVSAAASVAPVTVAPPVPPSAPFANQAPSPAPVVAAASIANAAPPVKSAPIDSGPSQPGVAAAPRPALGMAALSEPGPATVSVVTDPQEEATPETPPLQKKPKHQQSAAGAKNQQPPASLGNMLRRLFNPQHGASYYPNHGL